MFIAHCNTAPFDNNDLHLALKYAIDREEMLDKILDGYGTIGNDTPINKAYPLFTEMEQHAFDPDKAASQFKKSGHKVSVFLRTSDVAFPGAVDAAQHFQQSFDDFVDATGPNVGAWVADGNQEMMGGYALSKCWHPDPARGCRSGVQPPDADWGGMVKENKDGIVSAFRRR